MMSDLNAYKLSKSDKYDRLDILINTLLDGGGDLPYISLPNGGGHYAICQFCGVGGGASQDNHKPHCEWEYIQRILYDEHRTFANNPYHELEETQNDALRTLRGLHIFYHETEGKRAVNKLLAMDYEYVWSSMFGYWSWMERQ